MAAIILHILFSILINLDIVNIIFCIVTIYFVWDKTILWTNGAILDMFEYEAGCLGEKNKHKLF